MHFLDVFTINMKNQLLHILYIFLISLILGFLYQSYSIFPGYAFADNLEEKRIAVLLSDNENAYSLSLSAFINEINCKVKVFNLYGDVSNSKPVMKKILSLNPSLILTLGAKASYTAKVWTSDRSDIPVVFAMVLNWQRYRFIEDQDNIAGIAYNIAPGTQLLNMIMFSPNIKKVGVIYSKDQSLQIIEGTREVAKKMGLELIEGTIDRSKDFKLVYKKMVKKIDVFWMIADPVVYTMDNVSWLERRCIKDCIICIGESKNIAKLGVLLAVDPDIHYIGYQAASIAKSILLHKKKPKDIGVMPPLGTRLFLNLKTARKIGLSISPTAMDMANEIIDK